MELLAGLGGVRDGLTYTYFLYPFFDGCINLAKQVPAALGTVSTLIGNTLRQCRTRQRRGNTAYQEIDKESPPSQNPHTLFNNRKPSSPSDDIELDAGAITPISTPSSRSFCTIL